MMLNKTTVGRSNKNKTNFAGVFIWMISAIVVINTGKSKRMKRFVILYFSVFSVLVFIHFAYFGCFCSLLAVFSSDSVKKYLSFWPMDLINAMEIFLSFDTKRVIYSYVVIWFCYYKIRKNYILPIEFILSQSKAKFNIFKIFLYTRSKQAFFYFFF